MHHDGFRKVPVAAPLTSLLVALPSNKHLSSAPKGEKFCLMLLQLSRLPVSQLSAESTVETLRPRP